MLSWAKSNTKKVLENHAYLWAIQAKSFYSEEKLVQDSQSLNQMYFDDYKNVSLSEFLNCPELIDNQEIKNRAKEIKIR